MIEFVQEEYSAYYIITEKDENYYNRFVIADKFLNVLSQKYNYSIIDNSRGNVDDSYIEEIVYDAIDLFGNTGGLVLTFLPEDLVKRLMKVYNIYKSKSLYQGNIKFAYYGDLDYENLADADYLGNYIVVHYNPYNTSKENTAFKTLLGDSFRGSEYQYSDVLSYSIFLLWKNLILSAHQLSIEAITAQMNSVSIDTPLGVISVDESQHLKQSIYIIELAEKYDDSLVIHVSQNFSGNPFFDSFNEESIRLCDLENRKSNNYKPNLYYIGISLPLDISSLSNSMFVLRGVLSGIEYVNRKISKDTDLYIVPYILKDENDAELYSESVEAYGELLKKKCKTIKGGIIIGYGTSYLFLFIF